ncbi:MipA/OmpV family protein [Consotaella aegiceratis]|uniref:MipA/OmpV family protein n=1 Tax=Consotaella aegiceratis TaxID=3097961 RepID=UPI002F3E5B2B
MIRPFRPLTPAAMVVLCGALSPAQAADALPASATSPDDFAITLELGLGAKLSPAYVGSDEYEFSPWPVISLEYLYIPGVVEIGGPDSHSGGLSFGPSFAYQGERDSSDNRDLRGLADVDPTYEAGMKVGYEWSHAEVFGAVRYAFGGADGFVGDLGANAIVWPTNDFQLKAGPRASFASADYMEAYFGVSPAESAAGGGRLDAYDPDGGFKSVGVGVETRYEFRPDWFLNSEASYERLVGDAADSPLVDVGSADQFSVGLSLSRRFTIGF